MQYDGSASPEMGVPARKNAIRMLAVAERETHTGYDAIHPGAVWLDTNGKPIQAHGGALWYNEEAECYCLYGENKAHTDGKSKVWTYGIRWYKSRDLMNWEDQGDLLPAAPDDPAHPMFPQNRIDRPHILRAGGRFVLWIKYSGERACFSVWEAEDFGGPYALVRDHFRPFGKKAGDFDIAQDEAGRHWLFFNGDHAGIFQARLSPDGTDVEDEPLCHFGGLHPPFVREAPAVFRRNGKWYLLSSGMTGYLPNPTQAAVAKAVTGPYTVQGTLHVQDENCSSFSSQISKVFRHPKKKDLYIALADRWVPDYPASREAYESVVRVIASNFAPDQYHPSEKDIARLMASPMLQSANTSRATYVWLPLRFEGERAFIDWKERWSPADYE